MNELGNQSGLKTFQHMFTNQLSMGVIKLFYRIRDPICLNDSNDASSKTSQKDPTTKLKI